MAKDVKKAVENNQKAAKQDPADRAQQAAPGPSIPEVGPKVAYNIGLHSILMVVLPFTVFFASANGFLDPLYERTIGIPKEESKTIIGGVLAVVVVQAVIVSFVFNAFREDPEPPAWKKTD